MCEIHILVQQGRLLTMIYTFQLVNIKNCTFKALPINSAKIWNSINPDIRNQLSLNSVRNAYIKDYFTI